MATPRINIRQIRNILRLKLDSQLSIRQIKTSTQVSVACVCATRIITRAPKIGRPSDCYGEVNLKLKFAWRGTNVEHPNALWDA